MQQRISSRRNHVLRINSRKAHLFCRIIDDDSFVANDVAEDGTLCRIDDRTDNTTAIKDTVENTIAFEEVCGCSKISHILALKAFSVFPDSFAVFFPHSPSTHLKLFLQVDLRITSSGSSKNRHSSMNNSQGTNLGQVRIPD